MGAAYRLVVPGAVFGSLLIALFGFLITANLTVPASAAAPAASTDSAAAEPEPKQAEKAQEVQPDQSQGVAVENDSEDQSAGKDKKCRVSTEYPQSVRKWCELITEYANKRDIEPDLLAALIWQESGGNPQAYSKSGAVGLMQVMPKDGLASSFMCKNGPCFANRPTIEELQDPEFNVKYGTGMLANLYSKYGNMRDALLYYGPMDVGYYYADKVLGIYKNYRD